MGGGPNATLAAVSFPARWWLSPVCWGNRGRGGVGTPTGQGLPLLAAHSAAWDIPLRQPGPHSPEPEAEGRHVPLNPSTAGGAACCTPLPPSALLTCTRPWFCVSWRPGSCLPGVYTSPLLLEVRKRGQMPELSFFMWAVIWTICTGAGLLASLQPWPSPAPRAPGAATVRLGHSWCDRREVIKMGSHFLKGA